MASHTSPVDYAWSWPALRQAEEEPVSEENKRLFVKVMQEVFNQENLEVADELVAPDFFNHEAPDSRGPEGFKATTLWLRAAYGKLAEHWACRDDLGQFAQLGLTPPSAGG